MDRDTGKPIYCDNLRLAFDAERRKYGRRFNRLHTLSAQGREVDSKLATLNREWEATKAAYLAARAARPIPSFAREGIV